MNSENQTASLFKTFVVCALLFFIAVLILFKLTLGGEAFTTESLRRAAIEQAPRSITTFQVKDLDLNKKTLRDALLQDKKIHIVGFIYTNCSSYCTALSTHFQQLQKEIKSRGLDEKIGLLSISFDPERDTPEKIRAYAKKYDADQSIWKFFIASEKNLRGRLFDQFGVIVIPALFGEFEHNSALLLVDSSGRIVSVFNDDEINEALNKAIDL